MKHKRPAGKPTAFYSTTDKWIAPLLIAYSKGNEKFKYLGHDVREGTVIHRFNSTTIAEDLIRRYTLGETLGVAPKDYADAIEYFWSIIYQLKK